jgi:hypothetical protein
LFVRPSVRDGPWDCDGPVGTLPSTKDFIQIVWGYHGDDMANFKGFSHNNV